MSEESDKYKKREKKKRERELGANQIGRVRKREYTKVGSFDVT